jgi:diguanylate cyclase (GGDEF)-like protein
VEIRRHFEPRDPAVAAPVAGALVVVGAVATAVVALVDPPRGGALPDVVALAAPSVLVVVACLLFSARFRRSSPLLVLLPIGGLVIIAALDLATDDATISGHIFFCCPVLYAASQLRTGAAVATTAAAVAIDAWVAFTLTPPGQALTDVLYVAPTLAATALILIHTSRRQDATVRQLQQGLESLTRQATHDGLTGLPNRALFHGQVRRALTGHADVPREPRDEGERREVSGHRGVAVLFCDLDGFKDVNDSLGHRAGDELLVAIAHRLRAHVRRHDVVARLGGDEFAVLLRDADPRVARVVADRLLAAFAEAVEVAGQHVHVGVSIGLAFAGPGTATDVDAVVREADVAMYEAKAAGRGRCVAFTPEMLTAQVAQASLVQDLHGAVSRGEFSVEYQPVVDLTTGKVDGLEALVRWTHPRHGPISPATFIPLAERSGLIDAIGAFVLSEVSRHGRSFAEAAGRQVSIGVNVSPRQLAGSGLLDQIPTGRTEHVQLLVEVTESTLVRADVVPVLEELRRRGVRIAMDDFGVGQSSIAALRLMPVDVIKLDRAFTVDISTDPRAAAIVRAVATMARELDLPLVAEGIETSEQLGALTGIGCGYGQGYLLARPMTVEAMCGYLGRPPETGTAAHAVVPAPRVSVSLTS